MSEGVIPPTSEVDFSNGSLGLMCSQARKVCLGLCAALPTHRDLDRLLSCLVEHVQKVERLSLWPSTCENMPPRLVFNPPVRKPPVGVRVL